jgi:parallel beta-helix repeat protein
MLAIVLLLTATAAPGGAWGEPACGDTITRTVKLGADLDCSGTAVSPALIVAGRATLDLGGHTLTCAPGGVGVDLVNRSGVVAGGTVTGCETAVRVGGMGGHTVRAVTITGSGVGIAVTSGPNRLRGNAVADNGEGIALAAGANGTLIEANRVTGSQGDNIHIQSARNFVRNNAVHGSAGGSGIAVSGSYNKLVGNEATGNAGDGVVMLGGTRNKSFHTKAAGNRRGIAVDAGALSGEISQSKASGNADVDLFDDNPAPPCQTHWVRNRAATTTVGGAGAACIK